MLRVVAPDGFGDDAKIGLGEERAECLKVVDDGRFRRRLCRGQRRGSLRAAHPMTARSTPHAAARCSASRYLSAKLRDKGALCRAGRSEPQRLHRKAVAELRVRVLLPRPQASSLSTKYPIR